jgi:hypothetical protein
MATVITAGNATNGLSLSADNTGAFEFKTGTGAGTTALTLSSTQVATFAGTVAGAAGTLYPLISGTAVASTSGTSIDFTGIPSWVKRITVMLSGVSTNGSSPVQIQIGSGSFTTSGYVGSITYAAGTNVTTSYSTGFIVHSNIGASVIAYSNIVINTVGSNIWVENGTTGSNGNAVAVGAGGLTLGGTLDRVRITTVNGTDTFDAGSINILYE